MVSAKAIILACFGLLLMEALALPLQAQSETRSVGLHPRVCSFDSVEAIAARNAIQERELSRTRTRHTSSTKTTSKAKTSTTLHAITTSRASSASTTKVTSSTIKVATTTTAATSIATNNKVAASTWAPPSNLVTPLNEVWQHEISTYSDPLGFKNYGYDQVIAGKGKINYCVRWDSSQTVSAANRTLVETAVRRSFNKWIEKLAGFDGFPYDTVDVNVVGWAVRDKNLLLGDTSGIQVYTTVDEDGIPQCDPACGRFFHQDGVYTTCPAGTARHYDQSLWLTEGMTGGAGGDWGQRVGSEYFMGVINDENIHIVLHEMGHTFALDDFYDWTPTGVTNFIMLAGSSLSITDFDAWMARDWWRNLKSRYGL